MTAAPAEQDPAATDASVGNPTPPTASDWQRWGIDPRCSRFLDVASHEGGSHRWHVLDTGPPTRTDTDAGADGARTPTLLCVHGNPTWGYAWASFLRRFAGTHRVIAVDQLGMGFSDRTARRRYADRVRDLDDVVVALDIDGPLVLAAHDWGGAIALGWAVQDPRQVAGMILCNTGIAVPDGRSAPRIIRLAASAPLLDLVCRGTPIFVEGTLRLSGRRIGRNDRAAFRAPYRSAPARAAIADFVDDIPLSDGHPSERALTEVAERLGSITAPVLLAWGAKDPVFDDDFAADLSSRLPDTTLHRFPGAGHLVMAEADVAGVAAGWLDDLAAGRLRSAGSPTGGSDARSDALWARIERRRDDTDTAFVDAAADTEISWADLAARIEAVAGRLHAAGLQPGDRVAMLTPPGVDLVAALYGVWRAGGVAVVADRGLGLRALGRAVRSTRPSWVIGPRPALAAAATLRWAPFATRLDVSKLVCTGSAGTGPVGASVPPLPPEPGGNDPAAVLFTSGATGPAKGVRYTHRQLQAQRDALAATYAITPDDRLVAAFAPFALYGPALGITTGLPDVDVTQPGRLTADALATVCGRVGATLAFASPSALANVVATADDADDLTGLHGLRTVMSAGAPVPSEVLRAVGRLAPSSRLHTPYGMTEVLPVADIDLDRIEQAERDDPAGGVCVGEPVHGAVVRIAPLGFDSAQCPAPLPDGETGEILISAPWVSDGYDGLWATERDARPSDRDHPATVWHRSGDVGHLDQQGRLWVEGRVVHVVHTVTGPVTSVPLERRLERALGDRVAVVGVGPVDTQQIVVVVERVHDDAEDDDELTASVRAAVELPIAAVLTLGALPVDIRHNAKIDRTALAAWADAALAGRRASPPT